MTASSSATWLTTLRSWVTKTSERPRAARRSAKRARIWVWIVMSSAGRRLVAEQDRRFRREGDGDHDPLAGAPRQLVGIGAVPSLGIGDPDLAQQLERPLARGAAAEAEHMAGRLGDLVADRRHRVQGAEGVLEDDRHAFPLVVPPAPAPGAPAELDPVDDDAARHDAPPVRQEAHDRPQREALARARLPDDGEGAAALDREGDAVHGAEGLPVAPHLDDEVLDLEQGGHPGLNTSASPSPRSDSPTPV